MGISDVSKTYFVACDMIHNLTTELYESLHNDDGEPITDTESIRSLIKTSKSKLYQELDLIPETTIEYNEQKNNSRKKSFNKMS